VFSSWINPELRINEFFVAMDLSYQW